MRRHGEFLTASEGTTGLQAALLRSTAGSPGLAFVTFLLETPVCFSDGSAGVGVVSWRSGFVGTAGISESDLSCTAAVS